MDVTDQDIIAVLSEKYDKYFHVPKYQRGYDWGKDNWRKLWQDIQNIDSRVDEHFFGTLILLSREDKNTIEIVDGQQRLVTISLIVMAVRDIVGERSDSIDLVLSPVGSSEDRRIKYDKNRDDESYGKLYSGNIDEIKRTSNLKKGYQYFKRQIKQNYPDDPTRVMDKIEKLRVVKTDLDDPLKAYPIFQAQNDRGKDVYPHVLARSRVIGAADRQKEIDKRRIAGIWETTIEGELKKRLDNPRYRREDLRIRRPMKHILANSDVQTKTNIEKSDLYGVFETVVNSFENIEEFVDWFDKQTKIYLNTLTCSKYDLQAKGLSDQEARELLYFNLSNTQAELLSLAIYKTVDENKQGLRKQCFKLSAVLGMRPDLAGYTATDKSDPLYTAASGVIQQATDGTDIKDILRDVIKNSESMPSDEEIHAYLTGTDLYHTNQYQYTTEIKFSSLEEQLTKVRGPLTLSNLVVDHIAPRKTFKDDDYAKWRRDLDRELFDEKKDKLGNLILIDENTHKDIRYEKSIRRKMSELRNIDIEIASDVYERYERAGEQWGDKQIDKRTSHLAEELTHRWSLPV